MAPTFTAGARETMVSDGQDSWVCGLSSRGLDIRVGGTSRPKERPRSDRGVEGVASWPGAPIVGSEAWKFITRNFHFRKI